MKDIEEISGDVLHAAISLHRDLGPGLLESVYETVLGAMLARNGYFVEHQKSIDIRYDGLYFARAFRIDLLIDSRLIIEIKSVERPNAAHRKQLLTYLRLCDLSVGMLINFGGATLIEGVSRVVNKYTPSASPRLRVNQKQE